MKQQEKEPFEETARLDPLQIGTRGDSRRLPVDIRSSTAPIAGAYSLASLAK